LLDVVDRRTVAKLLNSAGFSSERDLAISVDEFLDKQTLVRGPEPLRAVREALKIRFGSNQIKAP
jgi:hypothetical protein